VKVTSKRIGNIRKKFLDKVPAFGDFSSKDEAYDAFKGRFKPTQQKFLDIALERFYEGSTLLSIASRFNFSREYIRQCEDKALSILEDDSLGNILGAFQELPRDT